MLPEAAVIQEPATKSEPKAQKPKQNGFFGKMQLVCLYLGIAVEMAILKSGSYILKWLDMGCYKIRKNCLVLMRKTGIKEIKIKKTGDDPNWPYIHLTLVSSGDGNRPERKNIFVDDMLYRRLMRFGNGPCAFHAILCTIFNTTELKWQLEGQIKDGDRIIFDEQVYTVSIKPKECFPDRVEIVINGLIN